jgi:hypothetical protein
MMPLMPAILPFNSNIAEALRPISIPPSNDAIGVKLCISEFPRDARRGQ